MLLRFLGTGAADWNGPDENGEYRRFTSTLLDGRVLIDATKTVLDMIPDKMLQSPRRNNTICCSGST